MESADYILGALIVMFYIMVGACLGSFASAVAYRISQKTSWIVDQDVRAARSCCPSCNHQLSAFDLIPVVSWLFLKGHCRYCRTPIPFLYPAIELCGAIMMVVAFLLDMSGSRMLVFVVSLPFLLSLGLLLFQHRKVPLYLYILSFSNIFVLISDVLYSGFEFMKDNS